MSLSEDFIAEIRREFPRFRIVPKRNNLFSRVIDVLLKVLTFGAQRLFLTHYHTVIGNTLYVPDRWTTTPDISRLITLRHERVHLRQRRRYGDIVMTLLYLLPFFPLGLAYGRARIEWEAYVETMRATRDHLGVAELHSRELRVHIVRQFTSGAYGWMWPFPKAVNRWYDAAMTEIESETRRTSN